MLRRFTILADGPTDRALRPIVSWVLGRIPSVACAGFIVEFSVAPHAKDNSLRSRVAESIREFPCDILFVHRDAEREPMKNRIAEIETAVCNLHALFVPIVPVRMTEAWLLIDADAIRRASDNPNGRTPLDIPRGALLEGLPDPKTTCDNLLIRASEKSGRRRQKFARPSELAERRTRIAELIVDFSPLLRLPAFHSFCKEVEAACARL